MSLSERTQQRLSNLIQTIAETERSTEMLRQVLAEQKMFEPYTAFKRLDQSRVGQVGIGDLQDFLNDNNITATIEEIQYLYRRLDTNRDGSMTYPEYVIPMKYFISFMNAILPKEDQKLRQLASLRDSYYIDVNMLLPYDVEWALARVFEQEIKNFQKIKAAQEVLTQSFDFSALECFKCIDKDFKGQITMDNLSSFVKQHGSFLSTEEVIAFFRVADTDEDGRISYSEFLESIAFFQTSITPLKCDLLEKDLEETRIRMEILRRSRELEQTNELIRLEEEARISRIMQENLKDEIRRSRSREQQLLEEIRICREQKTRELEIELKRSRERQQELEFQEQLRSREQSQIELIQSRERVKALEALRVSRDREEELSRELAKSIAKQKNILFEQELQKSRNRIEMLKQSKLAQEEIQKSRERQQHLEELRKSRERLNDLQKDLEKSRSQAKDEETRQSRFDEAKLTKSRIYETPKRENIQRSEIKESPLKGNEEHHLVMALKEQIYLHKELEEVRNQLSYKTDFHPSTAFGLLDPKDKRQLTKLDFELSINDLGLFPTRDDIKLLFERLCPGTSFLTYKTFLSGILPQSQKYQDLMLSRDNNIKMSVSTKALFISLLKKFFQTENNAELLRQRLKKRPLFNISQAFHAVDSQNQGFITNEQFKELFKKYGVFTTNKDIDTLVNIYDKDKKGMITYKDFFNELSPKKN